MIKGFKDFLLRGNVVDLAVAVVIGTAFTALVTSFSESFLKPLIALVGGGGQHGGELVINEQHFTWGAFLSAVITFVLTAAVVYFVVVLPMKKIMERRRRGEEPGPAGPTQVELLVEIRDLLRAQQGLRPGGDPSGPRHDRPAGAVASRCPSAAAGPPGSGGRRRPGRRAARPSRRRCRRAPATAGAGGGRRRGSGDGSERAARDPRAPPRPAARRAATPATASLLPRVPEPITTKSAAATAGSMSSGQSAGQAHRA